MACLASMFWFICAVYRLVFRSYSVGLYASILANNGILTACNLYYLHSFIPLHESINRRISSFNSHTKNLIDCVGFPDSFMDHLTVPDNTIMQPALVTDTRTRIEANNRI